VPRSGFGIGGLAGPRAHQHRLLNTTDRAAFVEQRADRRADAVWPVVGLGADADPLASGRDATCTTRSVFRNVHLRC